MERINEHMRDDYNDAGVYMISEETAKAMIVDKEALKTEIAVECQKTCAMIDEMRHGALEALNQVEGGNEYVKFVFAVCGHAESATVHVAAMMRADVEPRTLVTGSKSIEPRIMAIDQIRTIYGDHMNLVIRGVYIKLQEMMRLLGIHMLPARENDNGVRARELQAIEHGRSLITASRQQRQRAFMEREERMPRMIGYATKLYGANRRAYVSEMAKWIVSVHGEWEALVLQLGLSEKAVIAAVTASAPVSRRASPLMEGMLVVNDDNKRLREVSIATTVHADDVDEELSGEAIDELPMKLKRFDDVTEDPIPSVHESIPPHALEAI